MGMVVTGSGKGSDLIEGNKKSLRTIKNRRKFSRDIVKSMSLKVF